MLDLGKGRSGNGGLADGEGKLLLDLAVAVVGADDALHEVVADDVDVFEVTEVDAFDAVEDVESFEQAGLLGIGKIGLGEVAGDDGFGVVAEAGDEHLHLLGGGVLGLVHDDEGVGRGTATHEGERRDFDDVGLEEFIDLDGVEEIVEGVVEGAKIGIDLLLERAGQETEAFSGFNGGADEDDAADFFGYEGGDGHGNGEVGLSGAGGAEAEGHIGLFDGLDVLALVGAAGLDHALDSGGALLAGIHEGLEGDGGVGDDQLEHAVELAVVEVDAGFAERVEVGEDAGDAVDIGLRAGELDVVGAEVDGYVETIFHEAEVFVAGSVERFNTGCDLEGFFVQSRV